MRFLIIHFLFLSFSFLHSTAGISRQRVAILNATEIGDSRVNLKGWVYHQGHNDAWSQKEWNTDDWRPVESLSIQRNMIDKDGIVEGWFRIKIRADQSIDTFPLDLSVSNYGQALEVFWDGELIQKLGNFDPYERSPIANLYSRISAPIDTDSTHIIAIHYLHKPFSFPANIISSMSTLDFGIYLMPSDYPDVEYESARSFGNNYIAPSCIGMILLLLLLLLFLNPSEVLMRLNCLCVFFILMMALSKLVTSYLYNPSVETYNIWSVFGTVGLAGILTTIPLIFSKIFDGRLPKYYWLSVPVFIFAIAEYVVIRWEPVGFGLMVMSVSFCTYYIVKSWKTLKGAQWAIVVGGLIFLTLVTTLFCMLLFGINIDVILFQNLGILTFPLALLTYIVLRYREIQQEVVENANKLVTLSEERKQEALNQNTVLEQKVEERTAALSESLETLKSTQAQLIQSEKMASLGELTAGIAHEIQNPLNFVNNFSEVSEELIDEALEEIDSDPAEAKDILADLKTNLEKINHHGKRADSIVKGMLQHSRSGAGDRVPTDINALCDEYMRLAYHGLRAKNQSFNADYDLNLDNSLGKVNVVPQDMSRVLLNIITNAFQACHEHSLDRKDTTYAPKVTCSTLSLDGNVSITISDNGPGIPEEIKEKVFQPFFTTKPTGQGTGLGLSMAYDIIKAHGGALTVKSEAGQGSEFRIVLPV